MSTEQKKTGSGGPVVVFALTTLLGAFLLFQVQPLIGRYILPWFGGAPAVWSVALVFFQVALLAGYVYAHLLTRFLGPRFQTLVHLGLLGAACAVLPIIPPEWLKPAGNEEPTARILLLLSRTVGLPYFVLATTGPLLQAWFSRAEPGRSPYPLYALGNIGSLAALLSYPFVIEPVWGREAQAVSWSSAFAVFAVLCAASAVLGRRGTHRPVAAENAPGIASPARPGRSPDPGAPLLWILLPACATALLLAFTNKLCLDVASVPLLWVVPLSLYLLTFIVTFAGETGYPRRAFLPLGIVAAGGSVLLYGDHLTLGVHDSILAFSAVLFVLCMACHGEVYRLRPEPARLTQFYVCISLGGALGGIAVAIVAPLIFPLYLEFPIAVLLTVAVLIRRHRADPDGLLHHSTPTRMRVIALLAVAALALPFAVDVHRQLQDVIEVRRNFYGVYRVHEASDGVEPRVRILFHGTTIHGGQLVEEDDGQGATPTTYFGEHSGIGLALELHPRRPRKIGVLGLGVGTLAAYGEPGDVIRFYEIDPVAAEIARRSFRYLATSRAGIDVVLGDARLVLEREEPQGFDVLVMDAFTSDSVPVHLLTTEAFALYLRHLAPDGVVAINIANRYVDLTAVVRRAAETYGLEYVGWGSAPDPDRFRLLAAWVLLSRERAFIDRFTERVEHLRRTLPRENDDHGYWPRDFGSPLDFRSDADFPLWTDDYSNLFRVVK